MSFMFAGASSFAANLPQWGVGRVQNMNSMFANAGKLKAMDMSLWQVAKVKNMQGMFRGCDFLFEVRLPSTLVRIDAEIFKDCPSLNIISIPTSVTIIADQAFLGCVALRTFSIPKTVTEIGKSAFGSTFCCPHPTSPACPIYAGTTVCDCKNCSTTTTGTPSKPPNRKTTSMPHNRPTATTVRPTGAVVPTKAAAAGSPKRSALTKVLIAVVAVGGLVAAAAFTFTRVRTLRLRQALKIAKGSSGQSFLATHDKEMTGLLSDLATHDKGVTGLLSDQLM